MLNLPGSGSSPKKAKLVADLAAEYTKLNAVLEKTAALSERVAKGLKNAKGGGAGGGSMQFGSSPPPPINGGNTAFTGGGPGGGLTTAVGNTQFKNPGASSMSWSEVGKEAMGSIAAGAKGMAAAAGTGFLQAINPSDFVANDMARRSMGFYQGIGGQAGADLGGRQMQQMMNQGTATSSLDAANAAMMGASNGLMPGLGGGAFRGAAGVSNIMPGVGLEGGMEAQAALNKASSVNKLRMIGIQVRDANGLPRAVEDVARQVWNQLKSMTGGDGRGTITADDLSFALQSGNSLDSMLNQYFGNDPILRQSVIRYLYQFASGRGTSKKDLEKSNANPAVSQSTGRRNAAAYGAINAYTNKGVQGVVDANDAIAQIARVATALEFLLGPVVQLTTFMQTLSGGANGGIGNLIGGLGNLIGPAIGMALAKAFGPITGFFKGIFGGGGTAAAGTAAAGTAASSTVAKAGTAAATKLATRSAGLFAAPLITGVSNMIGLATRDKNVPLTETEKATLFHESGMSANGGMYIPSSPDGKPWWENFGKGGDGELYGMGDSGTVASPADGYQNKITSSWGKIRHLVIDGKKVTTKPHGGMDIGIPEGTSVKAVKDGTVIHTGYNPDGFGNNVIIQHDDGYQTVYGHLSSKSMQKGDKVTAGQLVGLSSNTGFSSGPHLHFQVQKSINGKTYDPAAYLSGSKDVTASGVHSGSTEDIVSRSLFSSSSGSLFSGVNSSDGTGGSESTDPTILPVGSGSHGGNNVTVNINVPASASINEQTLAREVKRILQEDERVKMAVNR
jgi:murein DD-endopeptidase MepM/ murein hydrolase activator NlpD